MLRVKVFNLSQVWSSGEVRDKSKDLEVLRFEIMLKSFISLDNLVEEENGTHRILIIWR